MFARRGVNVAPQYHFTTLHSRTVARPRLCLNAKTLRIGIQSSKIKVDDLIPGNSKNTRPECCYGVVPASILMEPVARSRRREASTTQRLALSPELCLYKKKPGGEERGRADWFWRMERLVFRQPNRFPSLWSGETVLHLLRHKCRATLHCATRRKRSSEENAIQH